MYFNRFPVFCSPAVSVIICFTLTCFFPWLCPCSKSNDTDNYSNETLQSTTPAVKPTTPAPPTPKPILPVQTGVKAQEEEQSSGLTIFFSLLVIGWWYLSWCIAEYLSYSVLFSCFPRGVLCPTEYTGWEWRRKLIHYRKYDYCGSHNCTKSPHTAFNGGQMYCRFSVSLNQLCSWWFRMEEVDKGKDVVSH